MKNLRNYEKTKNKKNVIEKKKKKKMKPTSFWLSLTVVPMKPQAEAWQKLKKPSKTEQSLLMLKHLRWGKKAGSVRISGVVELVVAQ